MVGVISTMSKMVLCCSVGVRQSWAMSQCRNVDGRGGRVVEGARLESVYAPKAYRGFESLSLRQIWP